MTKDEKLVRLKASEGFASTHTFQTLHQAGTDIIFAKENESPRKRPVEHESCRASANNVRTQHRERRMAVVTCMYISTFPSSGIAGSKSTSSLPTPDTSRTAFGLRSSEQHQRTKSNGYNKKKTSTYQIWIVIFRADHRPSTGPASLAGVLQFLSNSNLH